jgi:hypothetical protein
MRTSTGKVEDILGNQYDGSSNLEPFILTATALTDWLEDQDTGSVLSSSVLERIEAHLACHFYGHSDQFLSQKSTGQASGSYQGQTAMVLMSTQYGQTACLLDSTGKLSQRSKESEIGFKSKASITWMGRN